jgi:hypothetical protein
MVRAPHAPYSLDLAPSELFLFGHFKSMLQRRNLETGHELLSPILDLTGDIQKVTLERVFLEWMDRLAKCISINGVYIGGDE